MKVVAKRVKRHSRLELYEVADAISAQAQGPNSTPGVPVRYYFYLKSTSSVAMCAVRRYLDDRDQMRPFHSIV